MKIDIIASKCYISVMFEIKDLLWDDWNRTHIARHQVTQEEVEQVSQGDYIFWQSYGGRIMLVGETSAGRLIAMVLGDKGDGLYYPVTARPASRKERNVTWN